MAYFVPTHSRGSSVTWALNFCSSPFASTRRTPFERKALNPSFHVPSIVTSCPACVRRAANRDASAPVPTMRTLFIIKKGDSHFQNDCHLFILLDLFQQTFPLFIIHLDGMFWCGKTFGLHIFDVIGEGLLHLFM